MNITPESQTPKRPEPIRLTATLRGLAAAALGISLLSACGARSELEEPSGAGGERDPTSCARPPRSIPASAPLNLRVMEFPSKGLVWAGAIGADENGDIVLAGVLQGTIDFGGGPRSTSKVAGFIARFDASGKRLWDRIYVEGSTLNQMIIDPAGNIIVAGSVGGIDLAGEPLAAKISNFVAKLSPAGDVLWSKTFPGAIALSTLQSFAVDGCGDVFLTGNSTPEDPAPDVEGDGLFVTEYDPSGRLVWTSSFGGKSDKAMEQPWASIALAADGGIFLKGASFGGEFAIGDPGPFFIAKLDSSGHVLWTRHNLVTGAWFGVDAGGNVSSDVLYEGPLDVGSTHLPPTGHDALGVARFDALGHAVSATPLALYAHYYYALAFDPAGTVLVAGSEIDPATSGPAQVSVSEIDHDGQQIWSWSPPNDGVQLAFAAGFDQRGHPLVAGVDHTQTVPGAAPGGTALVNDDGKVVQTIVAASLFVAFDSGNP